MTDQTHFRDPRWNDEQAALRDYEGVTADGD
jgi:hypothetical protein